MSGKNQSLIHLSVSAAGVTHVTLARSEKRNALSAEMATQFEQTVETLVAQGVISAVLDADGPVFCAGADLREPNPGHTVDRMVDVLLGQPVHWTVLVRRPVLGAGLALLAASPLVLATSEASFTLPELEKGFFPIDMMTGQVAVMGARAAYNLAFTAAPIDAVRAVEVDLVSELCDESEIDTIADERAAAIGTRPAEAVAAGVANWQELIRRKMLG